jgi:hypothetical protein
MTRQDKPMPPDQRLRVVANLRKFLAANKTWTFGDVHHETGIPIPTLYGWAAKKNKPYAGANIEALAEFMAGKAGLLCLIS